MSVVSVRVRDKVAPDGIDTDGHYIERSPANRTGGFFGGLNVLLYDHTAIGEKYPEKVSKMSERFKVPCAVMLMLMRKTEKGEEILLHKRQNTGFADGSYDFSASGHVEDNESMMSAMCREAKEELNIDIGIEDLEFVCLIHKNHDRGIYVNVYFKAHKWSGEPTVNEPYKNAGLEWFDICELPDNLISDRKEAIVNYRSGIKYSEHGWK